MSNTYGSEPHDQEAGHDEVLTHEQEAVHEAPSDYEFADDHGTPVAEEHHDEQMSADADPKEQRRSPLLPIAAAVGGVVLLAGVAWWQFGGTNAAHAPNPVVLSSVVSPPDVAPHAASADESAYPASTVAPTTNADAAADTAPPSVSTGQNTATAMALLGNPSGSAVPSSPTAPAAPIPTQPALPIASVASPTPMAPAPMSPAPMAPMANASAPVATMPAPNMPIVSPSSGSSGSTDSRIDELANRMDQLQHSMEQATQQLSQVTNMVSASVGSGGVGGQDVQSRLDHMEQQINDLHHTAPKLAAPTALPGGTAMPANSGLASEHKTKMHPHHDHVVVVDKKVKKSSHHAESVVTETKPAASSWVLRAATPGEAWVATSTSAQDLKQVQVGDTLAGIGKVTAIKQDGQTWTVQGTTGSIR